MRLIGAPPTRLAQENCKLERTKLQHEDATPRISLFSILCSRSAFELARVLVRLDHVASIIVNANHCGVRPHPAHHSSVG